MSALISISAGRRYGTARVCRAWRVSRSRLYRGRMALQRAPRRRPGPLGPMPDSELVEAIRRALGNSPFLGEGYRKVWARLRHAGLRTSKERVRRLMRENGLWAANRPGRPRGPQSHDGTIIPDSIDTMWGTDMTAAFTVEHGQVAVFVAVDHDWPRVSASTLRCMPHGTKPWSRSGKASRTLRQLAKSAAHGLAIRHDHGSQYMSRDFQHEIAWLGAASSPAFIRAPEGKGCAERFIRTLKEILLWIRTFQTLEDLRLALIAHSDASGRMFRQHPVSHSGVSGHLRIVAA
jgi:putative transposase